MRGIEKISTINMSREDWLAERRKSIGGSDAAAILGLNHYNSAYALWAEKTGAVIPEDISKKEAVRLGNDLEPKVAERFMEATGKKVQRTNFIYKNRKYPFAHANPDRMLIGESAGMECKTTNIYEIATQLENGDIPPQWYCQMVHYMMVLGTEKWYLGALVLDKGFYWMEITRNEAEIDALASAERAFWKQVEDKTPPALDGTEASTAAIKAIYHDSIPNSTIDLSVCGANIETYTALCRQIKELEALKAEHENQIMNCMGSAETGFYGNVKITWKPVTRKTFDRKRYEQVNGPIPMDFFNSSTSRTFRVTEQKGAQA